ncbi:SNAPC4 [Bugula neritina]|uniref:SNAPC4 n=1 Tax=Bugula neritina TaxID=10212 RepID=A0A7J7JYH7_BUGNE|nr:SNAPC4 [Bugula neritina]
MKAKCLRDLHLRLRKLRQGNTDRNTPEQKEILYTIDNVKSHFELSDVSVEDVISHADWLIIANTHLEGAFSTESCINMYRNICNPVINRSLWSASEDVKLKELIQKHGHQSWSQVADELGTDRTPFICLQRYQQALNDYETAPWTQEREKTLCEYLDNYIGREDVISWDKVAWKVGEMTPNECKSRWESMEMCRRRPWTQKEDQALVSAVTLYGDRVDSGRRWLYIAADVKTRNSSACRDRWHTSLHPEKKFMRWSLEEDKILYDYLAEYDSEAAENTDVHCKRKYDICKLREEHFPQRFGNSITQRLKLLKKRKDQGVITDKYFEEGQHTMNNMQQMEQKNPNATKKLVDASETRKGTRERKRNRIYNFDYTQPIVWRESARKNRTGSIVTNSRVSSRNCSNSIEMTCVTQSLTENFLHQLLLGYPVFDAVSLPVMSTLRKNIRLLLDKPDVTLTKNSVLDILEAKRILLRQHMKERDSTLTAITLKVIDAAADKVQSPTQVPTPHRGRSDVETNIIDILSGHKPNQLSPEAHHCYSNLIKRSTLKSTELNGRKIFVCHSRQ